MIELALIAVSSVVGVVLLTLAYIQARRVEKAGTYFPASFYETWCMELQFGLACFAVALCLFGDKFQL